MATRRRTAGTPARMERHASSAALRRGLTGNLVAKRCQTIRLAEDRALVWWLQDMSHRDPAGPHYSCPIMPAWLLGGHPVPGETGLERLARHLCETYPRNVVGAPEKAVRAIVPFLEELCLNPKVSVPDAECPRFRGIVAALREVQRAESAAALDPRRIARTSVTETVQEALDFARAQGGITLCEGTYRCGKSISAQSWCLAHAGEARFVSLNSYCDDTSYFRTVARSLGNAAGEQRKCIELRARVEDVLNGPDMMLVVDEAEHLLPQTARPQKPPERVLWLMTALTNRGCPVAIVASKNFRRLMSNLASRLQIYGPEQWEGRIRLRRQLPDGLAEQDLFAIAAVVLPEADDATRTLLVAHTLGAKGRVAALENAARRAQFFAAREGRPVIFEDVEAAIAESSEAQAAPARPRSAILPRHPLEPFAALSPARDGKTPLTWPRVRTPGLIS